MSDVFVFPPYLFKSVFPSSFVCWSAFVHVLLCTSCVCCFCFFCHPGVYFIFIFLLLLVPAFSLSASLFVLDSLIVSSTCLPWVLHLGTFLMPKHKSNVKFHLRNWESVFIIDYLLLFKSHSVFLKMCMVNLQRGKETSLWHHYLQPVPRQA